MCLIYKVSVVNQYGRFLVKIISTVLDLLVQCAQIYGTLLAKILCKFVIYALKVQIMLFPPCCINLV